MTSILVVLAGFLIRIAFPVMLMIVTVYLLRHLDAHWQAEAIYRQKLEAGKAEKHSWALKNCAIEGMSHSPALQSVEPCWQVFRKSNGFLHKECLHCKVFRSAPILLPN